MTRVGTGGKPCTPPHRLPRRAPSGREAYIPSSPTGPSRPSRAGRPRRPQRAAAPPRLAAPRRSGRTVRPMDRPGPGAAARACRAGRTGPSPTATTSSARRSSHSPAAARRPRATCWSPSPCPATRSAGGATSRPGPWAPRPGAWRSGCAARPPLDAARGARHTCACRRSCARHRRPAAASLENVLVGADPGGRRLTAFVPVDTGRPLSVRLHQALYAAREAIDYQRATGGRRLRRGRRGGRQP